MHARPFVGLVGMFNHMQQLMYARLQLAAYNKSW